MIVFWRRMMWMLSMMWLSAAPALAQDMHAAHAAPVYETWDGPPLPADWIRFQGAGFTIHGAMAHEALLLVLLEHGDAAVPRLADAIGVPIGGPIDVFLTDTEDRFRTLQPGAPPVWADGTAYPGQGAIFLRHPSLRGGSARPLTQVLDHELVHVLLGRVFDPQPVPRWLQEGMAQVFSGEVGPEIAERISRGLLGGKPYDLLQISAGFPSNPNRADLAYAQSADFILWFQSTYGQDALRDVVRRMASGVSVQGAVLHVTGSTLETVNTAWTSRLQSTHRVWTSPEVFESSLWVFCALILFVGGWARRRAFRRRMATWEEEETALDEIADELLRRRHESTWFGTG
jgi:hypothetical protein